MSTMFVHITTGFEHVYYIIYYDTTKQTLLWEIYTM